MLQSAQTVTEAGSASVQPPVTVTITQKVAGLLSDGSQKRSVPRRCLRTLWLAGSTIRIGATFGALGCWAAVHLDQVQFALAVKDSVSRLGRRSGPASLEVRSSGNSADADQSNCAAADSVDRFKVEDNIARDDHGGYDDRRNESDGHPSEECFVAQRLAQQVFDAHND